MTRLAKWARTIGGISAAGVAVALASLSSIGSVRAFTGEDRIVSGEVSAPGGKGWRTLTPTEVRAVSEWLQHGRRAWGACLTSTPIEGEATFLLATAGDGTVRLMLWPDTPAGWRRSVRMWLPYRNTPVERSFGSDDGLRMIREIALRT